MATKRITPNNYNEFWHIALWLEEIGQSVGLQRYNMENVTVENLHKNFIKLYIN